MEYLRVVILGLVQGLTEFLPISSSGHLLTIPKILNWPYLGKSFDVALHIGTFIALVVYYRKDIIELLSNFFKSFKNFSQIKTNSSYRLPWLILISTIPAGVVGFLLDDFIEAKFSSIIVTIIALALFGLLLGISENCSDNHVELESIDLKTALIVGFAQILALIPGVSRSGVTITAALFAGVTKKAATNFSFLISIPIVGGVAMYEGLKILRDPNFANEYMLFILGILVSGISGYFVIRFLLEYLKKGSFQIFMYYRFGFALMLLTLFFWGIIK